MRPSCSVSRIIDGGVYTTVLSVQHLSYYSCVFNNTNYLVLVFNFILQVLINISIRHSTWLILWVFSFWSVFSHCPGSYWKTLTSIQYCRDTFQLIHWKILFNYSFTMNEYLIISVKVVFLTVPHLSLQTSFHRQFEILPSCLLSKP